MYLLKLVVAKRSKFDHTSFIRTLLDFVKSYDTIWVLLTLSKTRRISSHLFTLSLTYIHLCICIYEYVYVILILLTLHTYACLA